MVAKRIDFKDGGFALHQTVDAVLSTGFRVRGKVIGIQRDRRTHAPVSYVVEHGQGAVSVPPECVFPANGHLSN